MDWLDALLTWTEMDGMRLKDYAWRLLWLAVVLLLCRQAVRCVCRRTGTDFKEVVGKINENAMAAALFWTGVTIGISLVAANAIPA